MEWKLWRRDHYCSSQLALYLILSIYLINFNNFHHSSVALASVISIGNLHNRRYTSNEQSFNSKIKPSEIGDFVKLHNTQQLPDNRNLATDGNKDEINNSYIKEKLNITEEHSTNPSNLHNKLQTTESRFNFRNKRNGFRDFISKRIKRCSNKAHNLGLRPTELNLQRKYDTPITDRKICCNIINRLINDAYKLQNNCNCTGSTNNLINDNEALTNGDELQTNDSAMYLNTLAFSNPMEKGTELESSHERKRDTESSEIEEDEWHNKDYNFNNSNERTNNEKNSINNDLNTGNVENTLDIPKSNDEISLITTLKRLTEETTLKEVINDGKLIVFTESSKIKKYETETKRTGYGSQDIKQFQTDISKKLEKTPEKKSSLFDTQNTTNDNNQFIEKDITQVSTIINNEDTDNNLSQSAQLQETNEACKNYFAKANELNQTDQTNSPFDIMLCTNTDNSQEFKEESMMLQSKNLTRNDNQEIQNRKEDENDLIKHPKLHHNTPVSFTSSEILDKFTGTSNLKQEEREEISDYSNHNNSDSKGHGNVAAESYRVKFSDNIPISHTDEEIIDKFFIENNPKYDTPIETIDIKKMEVQKTDSDLSTSDLQNTSIHNFNYTEGNIPNIYQTTTNSSDNKVKDVEIMNTKNFVEGGKVMESKNIDSIVYSDTSTTSSLTQSYNEFDAGNQYEYISENKVKNLSMSKEILEDRNLINAPDEESVAHYITEPNDVTTGLQQYSENYIDEGSLNESLINFSNEKNIQEGVTESNIAPVLQILPHTETSTKSEFILNRSNISDVFREGPHNFNDTVNEDYTSGELQNINLIDERNKNLNTNEEANKTTLEEDKVNDTSKTKNINFSSSRGTIESIESTEHVHEIIQNESENLPPVIDVKELKSDTLTEDKNYDIKKSTELLEDSSDQKKISAHNIDINVINDIKNPDKMNNSGDIIDTVHHENESFYDLSMPQILKTTSANIEQNQNDINIKQTELLSANTEGETSNNGAHGVNEREDINKNASEAIVIHDTIMNEKYEMNGDKNNEELFDTIKEDRSEQGFINNIDGLHHDVNEHKLTGVTSEQDRAPKHRTNFNLDSGIVNYTQTDLLGNVIGALNVTNTLQNNGNNNSITIDNVQITVNNDSPENPTIPMNDFQISLGKNVSKENETNEGIDESNDTVSRNTELRSPGVHSENNNAPYEYGVHDKTMNEDENHENESFYDLSMPQILETTSANIEQNQNDINIKQTELLSANTEGETSNNGAHGVNEREDINKNASEAIVIHDTIMNEKYEMNGDKNNEELFDTIKEDRSEQGFINNIDGLHHDVNEHKLTGVTSEQDRAPKHRTNFNLDSVIVNDTQTDLLGNVIGALNVTNTLPNNGNHNSITIDNVQITVNNDSPENPTIPMNDFQISLGKNVSKENENNEGIDESNDTVSRNTELRSPGVHSENNNAPYEYGVHDKTMNENEGISIYHDSTAKVTSPEDLAVNQLKIIKIKDDHRDTVSESEVDGVPGTEPVNALIGDHQVPNKNEDFDKPNRIESKKTKESFFRNDAPKQHVVDAIADTSLKQNNIESDDTRQENVKLDSLNMNIPQLVNNVPGTIVNEDNKVPEKSNDDVITPSIAGEKNSDITATEVDANEEQHTVRDTIANGDSKVPEKTNDIIIPPTIITEKSEYISSTEVNANEEKQVLDTTANGDKKVPEKSNDVGIPLSTIDEKNSDITHVNQEERILHGNTVSEGNKITDVSDTELINTSKEADQNDANKTLNIDEPNKINSKTNDYLFKQHIPQHNVNFMNSTGNFYDSEADAKEPVKSLEQEYVNATPEDHSTDLNTGTVINNDSQTKDTIADSTNGVIKMKSMDSSSNLNENLTGDKMQHMIAIDRNNHVVGLLPLNASEVLNEENVTNFNENVVANVNHEVTNDHQEPLMTDDQFNKNVLTEDVHVLEKDADRTNLPENMNTSLNLEDDIFKKIVQQDKNAFPTSIASDVTVGEFNAKNLNTVSKQDYSDTKHDIQEHGDNPLQKPVSKESNDQDTVNIGMANDIEMKEFKPKLDTNKQLDDESDIKHDTREGIKGTHVNEYEIDKHDKIPNKDVNTNEQSTVSVALPMFNAGNNITLNSNKHIDIGDAELIEPGKISDFLSLDKLHFNDTVKPKQDQENINVGANNDKPVDTLEKDIRQFNFMDKTGDLQNDKIQGIDTPKVNESSNNMVLLGDHERYLTINMPKEDNLQPSDIRNNNVHEGSDSAIPTSQAFDSSNEQNDSTMNDTNKLQDPTITLEDFGTEHLNPQTNFKTIQVPNEDKELNQADRNNLDNISPEMPDDGSLDDIFEELNNEGDNFDDSDYIKNANSTDPDDLEIDLEEQELARYLNKSNNLPIDSEIFMEDHEDDKENEDTDFDDAKSTMTYNLQPQSIDNNKENIQSDNMNLMMQPQIVPLGKVNDKGKQSGFLAVVQIPKLFSMPELDLFNSPNSKFYVENKGSRSELRLMKPDEILQYSSDSIMDGFKNELLGQQRDRIESEKDNNRALRKSQLRNQNQPSDEIAHLDYDSDSNTEYNSDELYNYGANSGRDSLLPIKTGTQGEDENNSPHQSKHLRQKSSSKHKTKTFRKYNNNRYWKNNDYGSDKYKIRIDKDIYDGFLDAYDPKRYRQENSNYDSQDYLNPLLQTKRSLSRDSSNVANRKKTTKDSKRFTENQSIISVLQSTIIMLQRLLDR